MVFSPFSFFSSSSSNSSGSDVISLVVRYQNHARTIENIPKTLTLGRFKASLTSWTEIPVDQQKLIYKGVTLKGDDTDLIGLGLVDGAKILLIPVARKQSSSAVVVKTIASILEPLAGLVREVDDFADYLKTTSELDASTWNKKRGDSFLRLQELLMRIILGLDALNPTAAVEDEEAWKKERREAIKSVQCQLTRLDRLVKDHPEKLI